VRHEFDLLLKLLLLLDTTLLNLLSLVALIEYHRFELFHFVCQFFNIGIPLRYLAEERLLLLEKILNLPVLSLVTIFKEGSKLV